MRHLRIFYFSWKLMETYNGHVAVSLISDLLSKTKVYFFFKGDRSFDYCSRSYFWILLAASITLHSETARKDWFLLDKTHLGTKRKKKSSCAKLSRVYGWGMGSKTYYFSLCFPKSACNWKKWSQMEARSLAPPPPAPFESANALQSYPRISGRSKIS